MKNVLRITGVLTLIALAACGLKMGTAGRRGGDPLILRAHFIGSQQLLAAPESAKLKELLDVKASPALREEALNRFATLPSFWLADALPKGATAQTNLFRPLLDDLLAQECYLDGTTAPEWLIAVRLPAGRVPFWDANLRLALANWKLGTPADVRVDTFGGWEIKRATLPGVIRFLRAGDWVVVSAGNGKSARETEMLANIKATGRPAKPTGAWLDGDLNLARLDGWMPELASLDNLPVAHFSLSNRADFVRTYATLDFPKPHGWKPEPWLIPTNAIRDPLASFFAARGIAPVLDSFATFRELGYQPTPNQIFGWAQASQPFQFNYAAPSRDVRAQLKKIEPKLEELIMGRNHTQYSGTIRWETNRQEILWHGLPVAVPHLGAFRDAGNEYVAFDTFRAFVSSNRPPAELFAPFRGREELVAFDYEITGERLPHWRQIYHLAEHTSHRILTPTNAPAQGWLIEAGPKLLESVTELRVASPSQMTLVRKSALGLTSAEMSALGRWLESTNFPAFGVFSAQPEKRVRPAK